MEGCMPARKAAATRFARNGNADIAFEDLGGVGGEPLLLIMGMAVSRFWWPPGFVQELIERGFHVAAYDQRDAGESTRFPDDARGGPVAALCGRRPAAYSAEDMTDDAVAVLDKLGWDSAHIVGMSMGGLLAQRIALRHPARVRTVTSMAAQPSDAGVLATARYVHFGLVTKLARTRFPAGRDGDIALGLALSRALASPGYRFDEKEVLARIERDVTSGVRDLGAQRRQAGAKWHGSRLAELAKATLVLHGGSDPLVRPRASLDTAAAIKGARLVILPGVGHDLPGEVWPQIASEIRALADRASAAAAGRNLRAGPAPRTEPDLPPGEPPATD
jgi:pimeloyl-ACP methyl ester carboxylesterase